MQTLYCKLGSYYDDIIAASSVDTRKETAFLKSVFTEFNIHSVLDIACGTGRHSIALAQDGYSVTGVDYAEELLKVARRKSEGSNPTFIRQDVTNLSLDQKFDAAICMWSTFGELPYKAMMAGLSKVLNPKGLFVIDATYYPIVPTGSTHKTYEVTAGDINVKTEIDERYEGIRRIREITNFVNGEAIKDHSEMDVLTEANFDELLARYSFRHRATYYDYKDTNDETKRIQLVFELIA